MVKFLPTCKHLPCNRFRIPEEHHLLCHAKDYSRFSQTHPQKAPPLTLQPLHIKFLERNDALIFDGADERFEFEPYPLPVFLVEFFEKLDCMIMESDSHSLTQSVISVKSSSL